MAFSGATMAPGLWRIPLRFCSNVDVQAVAEVAEVGVQAAVEVSDVGNQVGVLRFSVLRHAGTQTDDVKFHQVEVGYIFLVCSRL